MVCSRGELEVTSGGELGEGEADMMCSEGRWPLELLGASGSLVEPAASLRVFITAVCCLLGALSGV